MNSRDECITNFLRYTPNDHNSFAPVYGRTFHANPIKVLFSESLIIVDYGGIFIKIKNVKVFRI